MGLGWGVPPMGGGGVPPLPGIFIFRDRSGPENSEHPWNHQNPGNTFSFGYGQDAQTQRMVSTHTQHASHHIALQESHVEGVCSPWNRPHKVIPDSAATGM